MSRDCGCGASVGTPDHWCAYLQRRHALRVERLLHRIARLLAADRDVIGLVAWLEELRDEAENDL